MSTSIIIIILSPEYKAVFIVSSNLFSADSLTTNRSITTSISCVLYLSKRIPLVISTISPSTLTLTKPCLEICSKSSR